MSTKFYAASNPTISQDVIDNEVCLHDTDEALDFFLDLNKIDPLVNGNWTVNILNYKGDIIEKNIDWRRVSLNLTVEDMLKFL